jgi:hypothetical protein
VLLVGSPVATMFLLDGAAVSGQAFAGSSALRLAQGPIRQACLWPTCTLPRDGAPGVADGHARSPQPFTKHEDDCRRDFRCNEAIQPDSASTLYTVDASGELIPISFCAAFDVTPTSCTMIRTPSVNRSMTSSCVDGVTVGHLQRQVLVVAQAEGLPASLDVAESLRLHWRISHGHGSHGAPRNPVSSTCSVPLNETATSA